MPQAKSSEKYQAPPKKINNIPIPHIYWLNYKTPRCGYQCVPSIVGFCAAFLYSHFAVVLRIVHSTVRFCLA